MWKQQTGYWLLLLLLKICFEITPVQDSIV